MDGFLPEDELIFSTIILQDTSVPCTDQSDKLSVNMLSIPFKNLVAMLIYACHSVMWYCCHFAIFLKKFGFRGYTSPIIQ